MSSYLLNRNGFYHFRIRIPADLTNVIPAAELVKSLKTRDKKATKVAALPYCQNISKTFTLLRSGYITPEQARSSIDTALKRRTRIAPVATESVAPALALHSLPDRSTPPKKAEKVILLSRIITEHITDKRHAWSAKTLLENESSYKLIQDLLGDADILSIDRLKIRELRDTLMALPGNIYKLFPNKTAHEVLKLMKSPKPPEGFTCMSITTVNKHIFRLSTLLKHCIKEGYISSNPASGLRIKQKRRPDEERKAYTHDDLKNIVSNLPPKEDKHERYWIPLLAMFSGMRLDETCQLHTEDVKER